MRNNAAAFVREGGKIDHFKTESYLAYNKTHWYLQSTSFFKEQNGLGGWMALRTKGF